MHVETVVLRPSFPPQYYLELVSLGMKVAQNLLENGSLITLSSCKSVSDNNDSI